MRTLLRYMRIDSINGRHFSRHVCPLGHFTATRARAHRPGTFTPEWQSRTHCHSRLGAPGARPRTATRARACRLSDTSDGFLRRDTAGSGHLKGL